MTKNLMSKESDDIDDLINSYKSNATVVDEENESDDNVSSDQPINNSSPENWKGNSDYFQTGNKAGQLKKQSKHKATPKENMTISGSLIDGALFIMLVDMLVPLLITWGNNALTKSKIDVEDLQMSDKQKRDLAPIADEVVKYLSLQANPIWLLLIAQGGIYGLNFMAAKSAANSKLKINR